MHYQQILQKFRGKVSRRILATVAICAIIPIVTLVGLTFHSTKHRLETDTANRLQLASKNIAIALMSELTSVEMEIRRIALTHSSAEIQGIIPNDSIPFRKQLLKRAWVLSSPKQLFDLPYTPTAKTLNRIQSGSPQLTILPGKPQSTLLLWIPVSFRDEQYKTTVAEINISRLLHHAKMFLPEGARVLLTDNYHQYHLFDSDYHIPAQPGSTSYEIDIDREKYLAGHWNLSLEALYNSAPWHIIVAEPKNLLFSSLLDLQINTALTAFATFWIVLLASLLLIKQTLQPLDQLQQATTKISSGDYNLDLNITSHNEFGKLATSFTSMAEKIQSQINYQQQHTQSVRDIFASTTEKQIIREFFKGLAKTLKTSSASLVTYKKDINHPETKRWVANFSSPEEIHSCPVIGISPNSFDSFFSTTKPYLISDQYGFPCPIKLPDSREELKLFHFYINIDQQRAAIVSIPTQETIPGKEELGGIRQLADQLGIALSRISMLKELASLNMGVLTALARTVDANSPWTHGHSERVCEYALGIARELEYSADDLLDLQRASLLHDLGKISIPSEVLNKPAPLTPQERLLMQDHPAEGDRIIEPIEAFTSIRPIVRQHHERWDGSGYPDGLKGYEICRGARILAVADVYDALYSERPYRSGWPQEKVINYLRKNSGTAFDPDIVEALIRTLKKQAAA